MDSIAGSPAAKLHTLVATPQSEFGIAAVTGQLPELLEHVERGAADNTVRLAQSFQHAERVVGDTAGAAVDPEAEVVGNAAAIDQERWKLRDCILVQEVADMS